MEAASSKKSDPALVVADERDSRCARPRMDRFSPYRMPLADPVSDPESLSYLMDFPTEARRAARAGGLEPLLVDLLRAKQASQGEPSLRALSLQAELSLRLSALETQVLSLAYEVHCTAGQVKDVVDELDRRERQRQFTLAVSSLVAGAVGGTASGVWALSDPDNTRGPTTLVVGSGLATAVLGALSLVHQDPHVVLIHHHNLLGPVWRAKDPDHLFPSFVFRMLNMPSETERGSPRAVLVGAWSERLATGGPWPASVESLLYGAGGRYPRELVELRQAQLEGLESAVQAIGRDLELLNRYLVRRLTGTPPAPWGLPENPLPIPRIPPIPPAPPAASSVPAPPPAKPRASPDGS